MGSQPACQSEGGAGVGALEDINSGVVHDVDSDGFRLELFSDLLSFAMGIVPDSRLNVPRFAVIFALACSAELGDG